MKEKLERQVRDRLVEMGITMTFYETRWLNLIADSSDGVAFFKHKNGHAISIQFTYDGIGDIIDFEVEIEY
jgi:hypothetical protein